MSNERHRVCLTSSVARCGDSWPPLARRNPLGWRRRSCRNQARQLGGAKPRRLDLSTWLDAPAREQSEQLLLCEQMSDFVTVDITQGRLRGRKVISSSNGITYYSFQSIPYAKQPIGPLRFKPPEEPERWAATRDATAEGAVAPQVDMFSRQLAGDEDCLFLNVYTARRPATTAPLAVMVWIHGGSFLTGSGNTGAYAPDHLVAEDVVLVTLNCRLGALGFLYLDGADVTGNNGLRDQVMALKWVRHNIAHFGGDPGNVTIFGQSAGGASVQYLVLSPLAAGLFHRAIAQSGTALIDACNTPHDVATRRALRLAGVLGCASEDHAGSGRLPQGSPS
ncbi:LOW QUALITY PROTEIN: liver carboxylesterase-like [Bacillus rossius redtenbacheri]|uniref:LOW QUALITY PROTEIN: liver carboxylesterase-like n=1 Tax=Bacillus rossius redtenbacheri TaxID=93214 RepID=UPI002FDE946F